MNIRCRHFEPMNAKDWIHFISDNKFTSEELCWIYCCLLIWEELLTDKENLPEITEVMLDYGMNPNQLATKQEVIEDPEDYSCFTPLIDSTRIDFGEIGVRALKLLLERGGDPNIMYSFGAFPENVFEFYIEDEFANGPDLCEGSFYGLLLCAAYGGRFRDGRSAFTMLIDSPISIFKDYERYWYEYVYDGDDSYSSTLYVIEKATSTRVAEYH